MIEGEMGARVADLHLWRLGPGHRGLIVCLVSADATTAETIKGCVACPLLRPQPRHHRSRGLRGLRGVTAPAFTIREGRLPEDRERFAGFIDGLQRFEHAFEPDRRIDARAGADYLPHLLERVDKQNGKIFVAEIDGKAIGWAVFHTHENMPFVIPEERTYGYIAELFVEEDCRGRGIGRALMAECEAAARALGLKLVMIGVLAANSRARKTYEAAGFSPYALELRKYL